MNYYKLKQLMIENPEEAIFELDILDEKNLTILLIESMEYDNQKIFYTIFNHPKFNINYNYSEAVLNVIRLGKLNLLKLFYKDQRFKFIFMQEDYSCAYEHKQLEIFEYLINNHEYRSVHINHSCFKNFFHYIIKGNDIEYFKLLINHPTFNIHNFYLHLISLSLNYNKYEILKIVLKKINNDDVESNIFFKDDDFSGLVKSALQTKNIKLLKLLLNGKTKKITEKALSSNESIYILTINLFDIEIFKLVHSYYCKKECESLTIKSFSRTLDYLLKKGVENSFLKECVLFLDKDYFVFQDISLINQVFSNISKGLDKKTMLFLLDNNQKTVEQKYMIQHIENEYIPLYKNYINIYNF